MVSTCSLVSIELLYTSYNIKKEAFNNYVICYKNNFDLIPTIVF